ncbi:hypothetical protein CRV01_11000 [Arcobacter sp. CECT 8983]|uniref:hypothetical protein n=1 Tax=Arcobacter sp. CECT 8983 TaxID=2044508 RepID=UPI00100B2255|nr:hypothetical protein [Arcobacter sp. CECT 8983]RXJ89136.1 hypothetical protein CRV01_11000 [Arcobacter sp. CECT 8983]
MNDKVKIFNDLISCLDEEKQQFTKKDTFAKNLDYVRKLLFSGLSTKKQIEEYSKQIQTISRSAYESYCKEYLKEEYEKGLLNTLLFRNIKTIAHYLTQEKNPTSSKLYNKLLESGSIKQARNKKDSSIDYQTFINLLKKFLKDKGYENIIEFDKQNLQINTYQKENDPLIVNSNVEEETDIKLPLVDGTLESCDKNFLKTGFIEFENSYIDNNIKEKNVYYIQARYIDKEYSFEKFKNIIKNNNILENYSIIIHNNSSIDTRLYIYRFIDNKLVILKSLDAASCVFELDELIRRGRTNFFEKLDEHIGYITS